MAAAIPARTVPPLSFRCLLSWVVMVVMPFVVGGLPLAVRKTFKENGDKRNDAMDVINKATG